MSGIFGGSKSTQQSQSQNLNREALNETFQPQAQFGGQAVSDAAAMLRGDATQFNKFKDTFGFDWQEEQGARGITATGAGRGLLRSGPTGQAFVDYGNNQRQSWAQGFLNNLLGLGDRGLAAGNIMANAGQSSTSSGSSRQKPGIGGFLGQVGAGIAASDRRVKTNIIPVGKTRDGLTLYQFRYVDGSGPFMGVMAQEVEQTKPEALGPMVNGYMTVNYDRIEGVI
jgi:hypothetical protein